MANLASPPRPAHLLAFFCLPNGSLLLQNLSSEEVEALVKEVEVEKQAEAEAAKLAKASATGEA